ncbi:uncharacterized protein LOC129271526 [Lytechinus pictus]|uniref:uncharacterized protein LOC129271526 n=1 Tax=Lytechinus pictus TaxID=7653 RepID=UPI0030B9FAF2
MSRLPKIQQGYKELYKETLMDDDESNDDTVPDPPSIREIALFSLIMAIYMVPPQTARRKSSLADSVGYFLVTRPLGHVTRMDDGRIPKDILYGEQATGTRAVGRPVLRFKDVCKRDMKTSEINTTNWETLAGDRPK